MGERPTTYPVFGQAEDLFLSIFRDYFRHRPDVNVEERYSNDMELPLVVPTQRNRVGVVPYESEIGRWVRSTIIEVSTFMSGPNRHQMNGYFQEACRHALFEAARSQRTFFDYQGHPIGVLNQVDGSTYARPENDWATTTHSVQYAKLPANISRYETTYRVLVRPAKGYYNPFLTNTEGLNRGPSSSNP